MTTTKLDPAAYPVELLIPLPPYGFAVYELQPELQEGWIARRVWREAKQPAGVDFRFPAESKTDGSLIEL
jgi:hypothetical protein